MDTGSGSDHPQVSANGGTNGTEQQQQQQQTEVNGSSEAIRVPSAQYLPPPAEPRVQSNIVDKYRINVCQGYKHLAEPQQVTLEEGSNEVHDILLSNEQFGSTYWAVMLKVHHKTANTPLIVKLIQLDKVDDGVKKHLSTNTLKVLHYVFSFIHPNLCAITDWFILNKVYFAIVEEVLYYNFEMIISQVGPHLYCGGIAHQNICPRNVFLTPTKRLKLSALEYATTYWDPDKNEALRHQVTVYDVKSGKHIPPEVASRAAYDPGKVDVYSFGAFLFYVAIGGYPYDYDVEGSVEEQWDRNKKAFDKVVSQEGGNLAQRCLMVNPKERIEISEVIKHPWLNLQE